LASYEKAIAVEEDLACEFHHYIIGTAVIPDELEGSVVVLYQTPAQPMFTFPSLHGGVKVRVKIIEARRDI